MTWRQAKLAATPSRKVDVPHLFELAAEVTALALQNQVDAVAREDLGDLPGAEIDDPPRAWAPARPQKGGKRQQQGATEYRHQSTEEEIQDARHAVNCCASHADQS